MTRILFIEPDGTEHSVQASDGESLMQVAVDHSMPGILGDCGGTCSCATCHAYVEDGPAARAPAPGEDELALLDGVLDLRASSRLICQITVAPGLDGLVVHLPKPDGA